MTSVVLAVTMIESLKSGFYFFSALNDIKSLMFLFSFANSLSEEKVCTFKEMFQMFDKGCFECLVWSV